MRLSPLHTHWLDAAYLDVQFQRHGSDIGVKVEQASCTHAKPLRNVLDKQNSTMWRLSFNKCQRGGIEGWMRGLGSRVGGRQNEHTLTRQHCWSDHVFHMLTRFATRATFVADTNLDKKMFLKISRNISCVRAACNNVAAFCHEGATSSDTMLPPQCVLVLPGP